jgi:hypothetical protein
MDKEIIYEIMAKYIESRWYDFLGFIEDETSEDLDKIKKHFGE